MAESAATAAFTSKIVPELRADAQPITAATPHPDNARIHDLPAIARSLNKHGQRSRIVVDKNTGFIVKGNGTWTAAAQILGWSELAMDFQELSADEAMAYLLADNKASDGAKYDGKKLTAALLRMSEGPGLLDTLWGDEELEDMIEAEAGATVLEPQDSGAEFADAAYAAERAERSEGTGQRGKMKEVPLVLTMKDHAEFVVRIEQLKKAFGTTGTVATIVEAIKRQAEAEDEAPKVGRDLTAEAAAAVRREFVVTLSTILINRSPETVDKAWLLAQLDDMAPAPVQPAKRQLPGQLGAFSVDEGASEGDRTVLVAATPDGVIAVADEASPEQVRKLQEAVVAYRAAERRKAEAVAVENKIEEVG